MRLCRILYYDSSAVLQFKLHEGEYETEGKHGLIPRVFISIISKTGLCDKRLLEPG